MRKIFFKLYNFLLNCKQQILKKMRSIGVFGEPVCKCVGVCACVNMFMKGAVQVDQTVKRGLGVLSIGTAPPRARRTEGMRYIVKPKNKISAEKRKKPSRPSSGASSHPLRTEVRLRNVRNLSRTKKKKIKTEEKAEVCRFTQTRVQTPGRHFLHLSKYLKPFPTTKPGYQ